MTEQRADTCIADGQDPADDIFSGACESDCLTANTSSDARQDELSHTLGPSDSIPDLGELLRKCELMSQALIAHSEISANIAGRKMEDADAIDPWTPLFTPSRSMHG